MAKNKNQTYNSICLGNLVYEFNLSDQKETEKKIKRRLKYYGLGDYDQEKVDYLQVFKNELCSEISDGMKSKYYKKSKSNFTALEDFNIEQMKSDYLKKYKQISESEMYWILKFAIYIYHLR